MQINKNTFYIVSVFLLILIIFLISSVFMPSNKEIDAKLFTIEKGQTVKEIALNLKEEKLIKSSNIFIVYAAITGKYSKMQAGEYLLSSQMSISRIINIFTHGETAKESLTIIEGWDLRDIAKYLKDKNIAEEEDFYAIAGNPTGENETVNVEDYSFLSDKPADISLEGYLFPDTYYIDKSDDLDSIVNKMLINFDDKITSDLKNEIKNQNKTLFEIITMASIIEKEVKTMEDKKIVSGILWKRMVSGMRLQVDATVLYAQNKEGLKVYTKDTQIDSPYNTYKEDGLPLGPISNPGIDSIIAAVYPTKTAYYYYLSAPDGKTIWAKTLEEHNNNKIKYLK
ncbi:MAG: endolytic transglycosylase MltG [Candidatus Paceibacterota bacterium]